MQRRKVFVDVIDIGEPSVLEITPKYVRDAEYHDVVVVLPENFALKQVSRILGQWSTRYLVQGRAMGQTEQSTVETAYKVPRGNRLYM